MNEIDPEWSEYLSGSAFKSKHTIISYKNGHRRLTDYLMGPIKSAKQEEIIEAINEIANNPNTKASLLNCAIVFYNLAKKDTHQLLKEKVTNNTFIALHRKQVATTKAKELPKVDELQVMLNKLYTQQKWRDFIVLWLMVNYNTRNSDVAVEIVNSIHQTKKDKKRNYLVRRKEDFVYIRYNYKTVRTYGMKKHYFKSVLMDRAVRYYTAENPPDMPLHLLNVNGEPMSEASITNKIKSITGGLTESDINKIQVSAVEDIAQYSLLKKMSDRRGTDCDTLITHYNLSFQATDIPIDILDIQ